MSGIKLGCIRCFGCASHSDAIAHARQVGIPVVWVHVALRPGYPELPETSPFMRIASHGDLSEESEATQILDAMGRKDDELLVTKRRVGAFSGSDLADAAAQGLATAGTGIGDGLGSAWDTVSEADYGGISDANFSQTG